jgi:HEAT repeat protein
MTYFCAQCWKEIERNTYICPWCGADQEQLGTEPFVQKLIRSLNHPEPETSIRAACILGKLKANEAIPALLDTLLQNTDGYILAAVVQALGEIGDRNVIGNIEQLLTLSPPLPVRINALRALEKLRQDSQ